MHSTDGINRHHRPAAPEDHHITVLVVGGVVIRQMVMHGNVAQCMAEPLEFGTRTRAFQKLLQTDLEFGLCAAHLSGDLVHPPLNRFAQAEIIAVQRQHRLAPNRVENPFADLDFRRQDASARLAALTVDMRAFNQVELTQTFFVSHGDHIGPLPFGNDVGLDHCTHQPVQRLAKRLKILAASATINKDKQITRVKL